MKTKTTTLNEQFSVLDNPNSTGHYKQVAMAFILKQLLLEIGVDFNLKREMNYYEDPFRINKLGDQG